MNPDGGNVAGPEDPPPQAVSCQIVTVGSGLQNYFSPPFTPQPATGPLSQDSAPWRLNTEPLELRLRKSRRWPRRSDSSSLADPAFLNTFETMIPWPAIIGWDGGRPAARTGSRKSRSWPRCVVIA